MKKNVENKKNNKIWKKILIVISIIIVIGVLSVGILLYGPYSGFRDWLITTAMTTMSHQYFATWFYDDETIQAVLDKNKVVEVDEFTDTSMTVIIDEDEEPDEKEPVKTEYANEYEKAVLEKNPGNNDYKIINIKGKGYTGYLAVIYDPSRVKAVCSKNIGKSGQMLTDMAKENNALIAINGGGFDDPEFHGTGSSPLGTTFVNGKLISSKGYSGSGGIIGFTEENKLVLGKMTVAEARKMKIRDAVTFGPYLIVNGKPSKIYGNGGWGTAPRTAIGQRQDGIVLFLVIDGRTVSRPGATIKDLIEIMQNYGAYNASNLDGGTSSAMVVNGKIINDPVDASGGHKTRHIATGFILSKGE